MRTLLFCSSALVFLSTVACIEIPPGLRPAKAIGEPDEPIVPAAADSLDDGPSNVRTPPNLSLRSRMISALNSPVSEIGERRRHPANKTPIIFQKSPKKQGTTTPRPRRVSLSTVQPPKGKNYGVNTLVQTNLVDANGRVIEGVNVVPIRVAPLSSLKNSRASASQVEAEDDKVVPLEFGSADVRPSLI